MPGVPIGAMPRGASVRVCTPLRMCPLDGESLRGEACSGSVPGDEGGHGGGPGGVHPGPAVRGEQWASAEAMMLSPKIKPRSGRPAAVLPVAQGDQLFDALAEERAAHAKGGRLWLSGLPKQVEAPNFPPVTLQIIASRAARRAGGVTLPGAFPVYMPITKPRDRTEGWKNMWAVLQQTLAAGEQALVHCLARAVLTRETISESEAWIRARRNIEYSKIARDKDTGMWVERMRQETRVGPSWPLPVGYVHGALEHPPAHDERCAAVQPQAGDLWCWALEGSDPVRHLGGGVSVGADFVPPLPDAMSRPWLVFCGFAL